MSAQIKNKAVLFAVKIHLNLTQGQFERQNLHDSRISGGKFRINLQKYSGRHKEGLQKEKNCLIIIGKDGAEVCTAWTAPHCAACAICTRSGCGIVQGVFSVSKEIEQNGISCLQQGRTFCIL
jgi:hypothetical protein